MKDGRAVATGKDAVHILGGVGGIAAHQVKAGYPGFLGQIHEAQPLVIDVDRGLVGCHIAQPLGIVATIETGAGRDVQVAGRFVVAGAVGAGHDIDVLLVGGHRGYGLGEAGKGIVAAAAAVAVVAAVAVHEVGDIDILEHLNANPGGGAVFLAVIDHQFEDQRIHRIGGGKYRIGPAERTAPSGHIRAFGLGPGVAQAVAVGIAAGAAVEIYRETAADIDGVAGIGHGAVVAAAASVAVATAIVGTAAASATAGGEAQAGQNDQCSKRVQGWNVHAIVLLGLEGWFIPPSN